MAKWMAEDRKDMQACEKEEKKSIETECTQRSKQGWMEDSSQP